MTSYSEVRRVRKEMSEAAEHDVRKMIGMINQRRSQVISRIIDPGTEAERRNTRGVANQASSTADSSTVPMDRVWEGIDAEGSCR